MIADDGKSLFDFLPRWRGRGAESEPAPAEPPAAEPPPVEPLAAEPGPAAAAADPDLEARVLDAIRTVRDPEIPVNLVDLGLIYELEVGGDGKVRIEMTVTAPSCPVAGALPGQVEEAVRTVEGVTDVSVKLVWTPPWHQGLMSEEARLELGLW